MIPSSYVYNGVNIILGVVCLIAIIFSFKAIPDKRVRLLVIVGSVLIILSGALLSFGLNVFKMYTLAWTATTFRMEGKEDALETVLLFKDLSLLGYVFEVVAIGLFAGIAKRLYSLRAGTAPEGEEMEGEAAQ